MSYLQQHGHTLVKLGYEIVPLKKGEKFPTIAGWQNTRSSHEDVDKWLSNGHAQAGIGVLCRNTVAVDIDCWDADINYQLVDWLKTNVGVSAVRVGQQPKCVLPYRSGGTFSKMQSAQYVDGTNKKFAVEILADGQQFVAFGVHPVTKKPYSWVQDKSIADIYQKDLPVLSKEQGEAFISFFESLAQRKEGWKRVGDGKGVAALDDDLSVFKPKVDMDEESVRQMVDRLDPDLDYDQWLKVGMALHHHFDGADCGLKIWDDWSAQGTKYVDGDCESRYLDFYSDKKKESVTLASVKRMEQQASSGRIAEDRYSKMLTDWALVLVSGSARIAREDINESLVLYRIEDCKKEHLNCRVLSGDEKPKLVNIVDTWLESPQRRTYPAGLTFSPGEAPKNHYNLWRGWSVESSKGDVQPWLDFVTDVVADGNTDHAEYIIAWAAQLVQKPRVKEGVALVLRGEKGTGKTKFGELLGGLFESHHQIVSQPDAITGNFNSHLEACLLLQADEAFWAGSRKSEGALKDLITNDKIQIERKGVDRYVIPNFTRFLFTSNADFVVPASFEERRFAVFDIASSRRQDNDYFRDLQTWYNEQGASALLHYLQNFDFSKQNLRSAPHTKALQDQKLLSADNVTTWLYDCLLAGEIYQPGYGGNAVVFPSSASKQEIYESYVASLRSDKYETPVKVNAFWRKLKRYYPLFHRPSQKEVGDRAIRHIETNKLDTCRWLFCSINNLEIDWADTEIEAEKDDFFEMDKRDD